MHDGSPVTRVVNSRVQQVVLVTRSVRPSARIIGRPVAHYGWLLFFEPGDRDGEMVCCNWVYVGGDAAHCSFGRRGDCWSFHFVRWNDAWVNCTVESAEFSVTNLTADDELDLPCPLGLPLQPPIPPPAE